MTPHELFAEIARLTSLRRQFPPFGESEWREYRDRVYTLAREGMAVTHEAARLSGGTHG